MKFLIFTLLAAFQLEARPASFAESAINQIIELAQTEKTNFCKQGTLFSRTIRSSSGAFCTDHVGAAVAVLACQGVSDFAQSHCAKNAKAVLMPNAGPEILVPDRETAFNTLTKLLDGKIKKPSDLCDVVTKVLDKQKSKCDAIVASLDQGAAPKEPKTPVSIAQKIIDALKLYLDRYNKTIAIQSGGGGRSLMIDLAFFPHSQEAFYEAKDFFKNAWKQNQAKLIKLAEQTKVPGFAEQESFLAVSIGSSSTQCYYMANGEIKTMQYLFGSNPSATKDALMDKMVSDIKALNRPVVFFNSISFAELVGQPEPRTIDAIDLAAAIFRGTKLEDGQVKDDSAGNTANMLAQKLAKLNVKNAFLFKPLDGSKFINKWTNALALESTKIPKKGIAIVGDIGGGGFSGKLVLDGKFYDKPNLVLANLGEGTKADEYYDQAEIVKHYVDGKSGIHKTLIQNMDKMIASVMTFIVNAKLNDVSKTPKEVLDWIEKNQDVIKNQKNIYFLIRQTGQLRELEEKSREQLGIAIEAFKKGALILPSFALQVPTTWLIRQNG